MGTSGATITVEIVRLSLFRWRMNAARFQAPPCGGGPPLLGTVNAPLEEGLPIMLCSARRPQRVIHGWLVIRSHHSCRTGYRRSIRCRPREGSPCHSMIQCGGGSPMLPAGDAADRPRGPDYVLCCTTRIDAVLLSVAGCWGSPSPDIRMDRTAGGADHAAKHDTHHAGWHDAQAEM
mgnify:CR=1 FL=1